MLHAVISKNISYRGSLFFFVTFNINTQFGDIQETISNIFVILGFSNQGSSEVM